MKERFFNTQARSQFKERYGLVVRGGPRKIKDMVKEGRSLGVAVEQKGGGGACGMTKWSSGSCIVYNRFVLLPQL